MASQLTKGLVVLALLIAAPVFAQQATPNPQVCSVGYFSGSSINVYVCTTTDTYTNSSGYVFSVTVPVSKPWFKAHCTKKGANNAPGYNTIAVCDAYAVADPTLTVKTAAAPSKFRQRLEMIAVVGVGTLVIAACVAGGGCGAMGGGL